MNKDIKKGTTIRIISDYYGMGYKGKEYTIKRRGNGWELEEDTWFYLRDELEGVHWEVVQPNYKWESKFNIGDEVLYKYSTSNIPQTIDHIMFKGKKVYYVTLERPLDGYYEESELLPYKEAPIKEMTVKEIQEDKEIQEKLGYKIKVVE